MSSSPPSQGPVQYLRRVSSPIGVLELTSDGTSVTSLTIDRDGHVPLEAEPEHSTAILERATTQLAEYFAGTRRRFALRTAVSGSAFQKEVWEGLSAVPWGSATSYGALGARAGHPSAGRAAGSAVRANPLPIIVPCHRVLGSDGHITGYSGGAGIETKAWLLEHEGIPYKR